MKKILASVFLLFTTSLFAQTKITADYVLAYRQAQIHFDNKEYGKSLKYAEDALRLKKDNVAKDAKKLENSLATRQVKAAGDEIDKVIKVMQSRDEYECVEIINYYVSIKGKAYFNNSVKAIVEYIKNQEQYPEVYKLIGDIYKLEGEYELAESYYQKAWEFNEVLDVPDEKYEILYLMADLSRLTKDYDKMEVRLLNIADKDTIEKRNILLKSMGTLIKKDGKDSLEKFFQLYRFDDFYSLNAYCQLADYYLSIGEKEKALNFSALAVITGFTKIENVISKRDITYEYTNLSDFLEDVSNYYDLVSWGDKNNIWKSFDLLCELASVNGGNKFAGDLLRILARYSPNDYWQRAAVLKLDTLDGVK